MSHRFQGQKRLLLPLHVLALGLIVMLAIAIRSANLPSLQETYAIDNDSYAFLRIAEAEVSGQPIPERDRLRWWPVGRDMTTFLALHSRTMARVYGGLECLGLDAPFRSFAIRYPIYCYALSLGVLYFWLARYISPQCGLIAAAGLAVAPATMYRSSGGFIDRDPFCLLLVVCAYGAYAGLLQERRLIARMAAAVLCGLFSAALGLTWEGVGLFTVAFGVTLVWLATSGRLTTAVLSLHLLWCLVAIPPLLTLTRTYQSVYEPYAALALFPVPIASLCSLLALGARYLLHQRRELRLGREDEPAALIAASVAAVLLGSLGIALWLSPRFMGAIPAFLENGMSPLGRSPFMQLIRELQDMFVGDWWRNFGLSLIVFLLGSSVMVGDLADVRARQRWILGALMLSCSLVILFSNSVAMLQRASTAAPGDPSSEGLVGGVIRMAMLPVWFIGTAVVTMGTSRKSSQPVASAQPVILFIAVWWILLLTAAAGAIRYSFFLAPAGWVVAGYFLVRLGCPRGGLDDTDRSRAGLRDALGLLLVLAWSLWIVGSSPVRTLLGNRVSSAVELAFVVVVYAALVAFAFEPGVPTVGQFSSYWGQVVGRCTAFGLLVALLVVNARYARTQVAETVPRHGWLYPFLEQLDQRLPADAVVLAWWEYGSEINVLARRATVMDENVTDPARVSEVARGVYCSENPRDAAEFLAKNGITHWLITDRDINTLPYTATLAAEIPRGGAMRLVTFRVKKNAGALSTGDVVLSLSRPHRIRDSITLGRLGSPATPVHLSQLRLRLNSEAWETSPGRAPSVKAIVSIGDAEHQLAPEVVQYAGRSVRSSGRVLPGIVLVERDPVTGRIRVTYIPKGASGFLAIRLFVLKEELPMFRPLDGIAVPGHDATRPYRRARIWEIRQRKGSESGS